MSSKHSPLTLKQLRHVGKRLGRVPQSVWIELILLLAFLVILPGTNVYDNQVVIAVPRSISQLPVTLPTPVPYPIPASADALPSAITARAVLVADYDTGAIMYEKNADERLAPASLVKLLTALVAMDYCDLQRPITVRFDRPLVFDESRMRVWEGEVVTFESLLYGMLLPSGNDAALAIAHACKPLGRDFMALMNEKAALLGLTQSYFTNPTGQDELNNYSSARDLYKLTKFFISNPALAQIVNTSYKQVTDVSGNHVFQLQNTNILLRQYKYVFGVKTGTTDNARQNYIGLFKVGADQRIFLVELASEDRFQEALALYSWIGHAFAWKHPGPIPDYSSLFATE